MEEDLREFVAMLVVVDEGAEYVLFVGEVVDFVDFGLNGIVW